MRVVIFVKIKISFFTCTLTALNMPLVYQQNINDNAKIGVWHITETESFFSEHYSSRIEINHHQKRIQHLAGRFLLKKLDDSVLLDTIMISEKGMPYLKNNDCFFSISHSDDFVAVIINKDQRVGIDIESVKNKIETISSKFITEDELKILSNTGLEMKLQCTLGWTIKEAMYKWYGLGNVDFKKNLKIISFEKYEDYFLFHTIFLKDGFEQSLKIKSMLIQNKVMSWVEV